MGLKDFATRWLNAAKFWAKPKFLIVHHLGEMPLSFDDDKAVEIIDGWHRAKGWLGIGYHKLITRDGKVLQGRPDTVIGSQAYGANQYSLGILVIGDFRRVPPGSVQLSALINTLAIVAGRHGIPAGVCNCNAVKKRNHYHIIGHRDVAEYFPDGAPSDCPGDALYALLPGIRTKVAGYL